MKTKFKSYKDPKMLAVPSIQAFDKTWNFQIETDAVSACTM